MPSSVYVRVREAADITGVPLHIIRKSFIRPDKRPKNVPPPPPHKKLGRSVLIIAAELPAWAASIGAPVPTGQPKAKRGRPTKVEAIARRQITGGEG